MPLIMKILLIPDTHDQPEISKERFTWAGNLIVDRKPDYVIQQGDFSSLQSLSHHEFHKKSSEGKRYDYDVESAIQAQEALFKPIIDYNRTRKVKYKPELHITLGNHEGWVAREVEYNAKLEYTLDVVRDFRFEDFGWNITPFKSVLHLHGINFSHYFPNGNFDKAISGVNAAKTMVDLNGASCIAGHSHLYREYNKTILGKDGKFQRIWGLTTGCYFEHEMFYCGVITQNQWWRGLVMLDLIDDGGDFNIEKIDMETIKKVYR